MSGEMALWAVRQDIKDPIAKLVLVALCEHCNEVGECYPNHETLSDYVRRSKVYIREKIRLLEANGWLRRSKRFGPNGRQTSNLYIINEDRGETRKAYHARKSREAEEKASKRSKTKSSGDAPPSPKSSDDAMASGGHDARQAPVSVMSGKQPMNNKDKKKSAPARGASGAKENLSPEEVSPAAAPCPPSDPEPAYISDDRGWKRLEMSANPHGKGWLPNWGAPPHDAKCTTPADVIQRYERKFGRWKEKGGYGRGIETPTASKQSWQQAGNATIN